MYNFVKEERNVGMRTLTVKRKKKFTASLAKMKVYIEDPQANEITINDTPCRFLGTLKNGEEKSFEISESRAKVFVIADKLSKNFCNDFYEIPESDQDVYLSGMNIYNPAVGNPFRFDNNDSEEVEQHRKKNNKKGLIIFLAMVVAGFIIGLVIVLVRYIPREETFSNAGLTITLTSQFEEVQVSGYDITYSSEDVAVFALEESFAAYPDFADITVEEYIGLVIESNEVTGADINKSAGLTYFEYEYEDTAANEVYAYRCFAYKTEDAFWLVQFAVTDDKYDEYSSKINEWANSVEFD